MSKHEYGGINIKENKGAFAIGEQNTVNQTVNGLEENKSLTEQFLKNLAEAKIPDEQKEEFKQIVETASNEASKDNPNKTILKSLLQTANSIMDTINKSPQLISAYEKWGKFIETFINPGQ